MSESLYEFMKRNDYFDVQQAVEVNIKVNNKHKSDLSFWKRLKFLFKGKA